MTLDRSAARSGGFRGGSWQRSPWLGWTTLLILGGGAELGGHYLPAGPIRALVTLPPILFIPGFALLSVVLGRSRPRDPAALGTFSITLSFAVLMLDALVLNAARVHLSTVSIGFSALLATAILVGLNTAVGREVVPPRRARQDVPSLGRAATATRCLALAASVAVALGTVSFVATHIPKPAAAPFASISLASSWAGRASAPHVRTGERVTIPVVATSDGTVAGRYELTTSIDGKTTSARSLYLATSGKWSGVVSVITPAGRFLHRVVVSLASGDAGASEQVVVYLENDA